MKSIAELSALREAMQPKMAVRRGLALIEKDGYRRHVLICAGTGCTSSKSLKIAENLENALKAQNLENDVQIVKTGCFGLCAVGPIMIVYPEGTFYSSVQPEDVDEIVETHLKNGKIVDRGSFKLRVGDVISINAEKSAKVADIAKAVETAAPAYFEVDKEALKITVARQPMIEEIPVNVESLRVVEYYAR